MKIELKNIGITVAAFLVLTAGVLAPVAAQYFGRNKVNYEQFDFKILETENFDVFFYPREKQAAVDAAVLIERWYARFTAFWKHRFKSRQPLVLYADHADFQQTNVIGGLIGQGTGGVTEGLRNRIVLPLTGVYADNDHVLGHELVHAFQYDIAKQSEGGLRAMSRAPLWFIEGMAEYLSTGRTHPLTAMWLRDAVLHDDIPTFDDLTSNPDYFPYRFGHAAWAFLAGEAGNDRVVIALFHQLLQNRQGGLDAAFKKVLNDSTESLSKKWSTALRQTYAPQIEKRQPPDSTGFEILRTEGGVNLSPVISPDGKYVILLSRRDLFTMDLYLADAQSGKILKKLVSSNSDAHFDALRFIDSAGSWSPDGSKLAFVVFAQGDNQVAILDVKKQKVIRKFKIRDLTALTHIAWSPDGDALAITGLRGGISDLFIYDLDDGSVRQLTDDRYAEIHPAWSPDGETIAVVTDRGEETSFDQYTFGKPKIALIEVSSGNFGLLAMSPAVKHINPQFSSDGKSLYFVANPEGVSNIYRYAFETQDFFRVTNVATGITGITDLSPCLSVAQKTGQLVFSVFDHRDYVVHGLEQADAEGVRLPRDAEIATDSALPPVDFRGEGLIEEFLSHESPRPDTVQFSQASYDASLGLQYVGQTTIGVGVDRFGSSVGGGVSFMFSDMLNNHMLGLVAQVNGGLKDIGGQAVYHNRSKRWHWGVAAGHIPYRTGFSRVGLDTVTVDGDRIIAQSQELILQRVFTDRLSAFTEYPLSTNRRFEFSAGFSRISYDFEVERVLVAGNQIIDQQEEDLEAPDGLNLFQGSIAYVGDYSFFGFTSPVRGRRFRFELEPTFGSLQYVTALADYRQYHFMKPFTFAWRAMHFGRYTGDSESAKLTPLFLGFETFVRGYDVNSFEPGECSGSGASGTCPEFDRLLGSRIGVINAELRMPLFGTEEFGFVDFPVLATELSAFFDAGVAWTSEESPVFKLERRSSERIPVMSTGVAARVNLLGSLLLQWYYVYPLQRPEKGWHLGFAIAPGW